MIWEMSVNQAELFVPNFEAQLELGKIHVEHCVHHFSRYIKNGVRVGVSIVPPYLKESAHQK